MKTPKQRFLETPLAKSFVDVVSQPDFRAALDYALLEMIQSQKTAVRGDNAIDTYAAMAYTFRLEGAKVFMAILSNLPIPEEPREPVRYDDNLRDP